jgi:hypothetical protein
LFQKGNYKSTSSSSSQKSTTLFLLKQKKVPWGLLYNISKEELLILKKTLIELLDKGFIRVNNSFAEALVLFARTFSEGLRFYINYKRLNEIIQKKPHIITIYYRNFATIVKSHLVHQIRR